MSKNLTVIGLSNLYSICSQLGIILVSFLLFPSIKTTHTSIYYSVFVPMTILRSREIFPTKTTPKTSKKKLKSSVSVPSTPSQTFEPFASQTSSPLSSSRLQESKSTSDVVSVGFGSSSVPVSGATMRRSLRLVSKRKDADEDLGMSYGGNSTRKRRNVSPDKDAWLTEDKENGGGLGGDDQGTGQSADGGFRVSEFSDVISKPEMGSAGNLVSELIDNFVGLDRKEESEVKKEGLSDLDGSELGLGIGNIEQKSKKAKGKMKLDNDLNISAGKNVLNKGLVEDRCARRDKGKGKLIEDDIVYYDMNRMHCNSSRITGDSIQDDAFENLEDFIPIVNGVHEHQLLSMYPGLYENLEYGMTDAVDTVLRLFTARPIYNEQVETARPIYNEQVETARPIYNEQVETARPIYNEQVETARPIYNEQVETAIPAESEFHRSQRYSSYKNAARRFGPEYAHYQSEEEEDNAEVEDVEDVEDWPGPFSTAMKIIEDRKTRILGGKSSTLDQRKCESIIWVPKPRTDSIKRSVPSLLDLCTVRLSKYADAIVSLEGVPDFLRNRLCQLLIDSHSMNTHIFKLFLHGSPGEVRLKNCSWLSEEDFSNLLQGLDANNLTVLHLNQCGRCLPDYLLFMTLAKSSNSFPALISLSVSGACRLSDDGLKTLVSSVPTLRSINLSQCSLLTSSSIDILANSLGPLLRELYLDDCQNLNAELMLPGLKKLEQLEVLSLAHIEDVTDAFIKDFVSVRGHNMKELVLTKCVKLTDKSLKIIAKHCPGLLALDIKKLCKLTDNALRYLANGCPSIQKLNLCQNPFSDESIAAFIEILGDSLKELSLNHVKEVGNTTALSLAKCSRNLKILDVSFCRNLPDEALGLIVDNCLSLRMLKVFGCFQITNFFLDGHSNLKVKITGLVLSPVLESLPVIEPYEGPLCYSSVDSAARSIQES